jgi:hypothetical protein
MARSATVRRAAEKPASKLYDALESHLSKLPPAEQARRLDALEEYVKKNAGDAGDAGSVRVARVDRRAKR